MALLCNLFALVLPFMGLFLVWSMSRNALPGPSSLSLQAVLMLSFLLLMACSAIAVLAMMHTDKPDAVYLRRKVGAITNTLLALVAMALAIVSGQWPIMIVSLYIGLNFFVIVSNRRRVRKGVCLSCDYNLTGLTSATCPECGHVIAQTRGGSS